MAFKSFIVTDLSYGDAGKGSTVDYLSRKYESNVVVRFNGASQAAHNVITPEGTHHVFSQFGSGSFNHKSKTFLSKYMLINPLNMLNEANHLIGLGISDIWEKTFVDRACIIITPWHEATNRLKEVLRDKHKHGSCGHGIGEAVKDSLEFPELTIRVRDLAIRKNRKFLISKLKAVRAHKLKELRDLEVIYKCEIDALSADIFTSDSYINKIIDGYFEWSSKINFSDIFTLANISNKVDAIIFEGSQGVLLDEYYGFHPYTTWSTTTSENALKLLNEIDFEGENTKLGLIRAYTTRHGAGPFVTQDDKMTEKIIERHNTLGTWQGAFRIGWLDLIAHKYAIEANGGIDALVVSGLDQITDFKELKVCTSYGIDNEFIDTGLFNQLINKNAFEMKLGGKYDLNAREKLAIALDSVTPNYERIYGSPVERINTLLNRCEQILNSKVLIKSYGPTASDKTTNGVF